MKTPTTFLFTLSFAIMFLSSSVHADWPTGVSHVVAVQAQQANSAGMPSTDQTPKGYAFVTYESITVAADESEVINPFGPDIEIPDGVAERANNYSACVAGCDATSTSQEEYQECVAECRFHFPIGREEMDKNQNGDDTDNR